jgi:predicted dithiol-disulfide oxidoreductase (DUF899 family)
MSGHRPALFEKLVRAQQEPLGDGEPDRMFDVGCGSLVAFDVVRSVAHHAALGRVIFRRIGRGRRYFSASRLINSQLMEEGGGGTITRPPFGSVVKISCRVPVQQRCGRTFGLPSRPELSGRVDHGSGLCHEQPSRVHSKTNFKEETNMSELRFPNESREYRDARDSLLKDEQELIDKVKSVAEKRRNLPLGGQLKEDYVFQWANDGKVGKSVKFSELFADKNTLLLYSFMYGPNWDNPCPSCTSLVDGFDRTWYQVTQSVAFVAIAKAPADRINAWAKRRGWSQIALVSGSDSAYQADYKCQGDSDDMQWPVMHVFRRQDGKIFHFWGTELSANHVDTVWPCWNLMDFTPEGRPDIPTPPQNFRSEFLEKHYLNKE